MAKVEFTQDYRGVLTSEVFYQKGDVAELAAADRLVEDGRAKFLDEPGSDAKHERDFAPLADASVSDLKSMARARGIKGFSKMKRPDLLAALSD